MISLKFTKIQIELLFARNYFFFNRCLSLITHNKQFLSVMIYYPCSVETCEINLQYLSKKTSRLQNLLWTQARDGWLLSAYRLKNNKTMRPLWLSFFFVVFFFASFQRERLAAISETEELFPFYNFSQFVR